MRVGYARTSTDLQVAGLDDQVATLKKHGCEKIVHEHISAMADRPLLVQALAELREGDEFVVTHPCRLARSTSQILSIADALSAKGVALSILSFGMDTSTATGKLVLTVLAGVSEFERSLMLERQRAGIAKAKSEGKFKGRAPTAIAKSEEILSLKRAGVKIPEIIQRTGVSRASVYRIIGPRPKAPKEIPHQLTLFNDSTK